MRATAHFGGETFVVELAMQRATCAIQARTLRGMVRRVQEQEDAFAGFANGALIIIVADAHSCEEWRQLRYPFQRRGSETSFEGVLRIATRFRRTGKTDAVQDEEARGAGDFSTGFGDAEVAVQGAAFGIAGAERFNGSAEFDVGVARAAPEADQLGVQVAQPKAADGARIVLPLLPRRRSRRREKVRGIRGCRWATV